MSFHFACRRHPVKRSYIESCLRLRATGVGPTCFSRTQKVLISCSTSSHRSNVQCNWCSQNATSPAKKSLPSDGPKCHVSLVARNHYSPSEIRTLKIGRRQTSLGCGTAYQLLPRSPTFKIHGLSWKLHLHAPPGVRRSRTTSPRAWRGCHQGGLLVIGIVHVTVPPLVTGGRDTHTPYSYGVALVFINLAGNSFWYVCTQCTIQLCCCVSFFNVAGKLI